MIKDTDERMFMRVREQELGIKIFESLSLEIIF